MYLHIYIYMYIYISIYVNKYICVYVYVYKSKAIPVQARRGPEGSRRLRLRDFKTIGT